jgi:trigger factor
VKATKETLSPTRVKLTVEVPFDELKPSVDAAYRKLAREVRVSGFRPGKVPPRILDQRLGRGVVLEEAINQALPQLYADAVQQEQVEVLSRPDVDITDFSDGAPLVFTAEVDVRPELTLPEFSSLRVEVDSAEVTDADVEESLTSMRDRFAVLQPVERPVETGDFVSIDLSATVDGENVEGAEATGMSYEVGSGNLIDNLDEAIVGAVDDESRTFSTTLVAGEHEGRQAEVTVTVRGVKVKELPELDDDFATTASEFDTLEELRADVRERVAAQKLTAQRQQAQQGVLDALIEQVEVPVPEALLHEEIDAREHRLEHELEQMKISKEQYLSMLGRSEEEQETDTRTDSERAIRTQFLMDAIVEAESISLDQGELMSQIISRAQRAGMSPEVYAQQLAQGEALPLVMAEAQRSKALAFLAQQATVVDHEDNPVELVRPSVEVEDEDGDEDGEPGEAELGGAELGGAELGAAELGAAGAGETAEAAARDEADTGATDGEAGSGEPSA